MSAFQIETPQTTPPGTPWVESHAASPSGQEMEHEAALKNYLFQAFGVHLRQEGSGQSWVAFKSDGGTRLFAPTADFNEAVLQVFEWILSHRGAYSARPSSLGSRAKDPLCRIAIPFGPFDPRKFKPPWVARVRSWPANGRPSFEFGKFLRANSAETTKSGEAVILADPGDIVRWGIKPQNADRSSESHWGVVQRDGKVRTVSEAEARSLFKFG